MKPRRVSSSSSSSARSSRNPPIEKSGVRSSCDAFATNSLRALSSCASCTRILSNARASSPISSFPWSTIGASKSPPAMRSAAVSSRRSRCESIPAAVRPRTSARTSANAVASSSRSRTSRHGRERVGERRLEEHDRLLAERDGDVRVVAAAVQHASALDVAAHERGERNRVLGDVARVLRLRVGDDDEGRAARREHVERDDACVRRDREALDALLPEQPVLGERAGKRSRDRLSSWSSRASTSRRSSEGTTIMYAVPSAPATIPTRTRTMRIRIPPGSDMRVTPA